MRWVETELESIHLGDQRLNKRAIRIVEGLGLAPGRTIPQTFQTWGEIKACYNFFSNDLVSDSALLAPHVERTTERIKEYPVVLLLSDTTEIDYSSKEAMKGKERLSNKKHGIWLHPTLAVTPERLALGVVNANFWSREPEVGEDSSAYRTARDNAPIEEKESYRWLQSYVSACEIARQATKTQIINVADREGDILEVFAEALEQEKLGPRADFIIRSQYDRLIEDSDAGKLRQKLQESASLGEIEFTVSATDTRKARKVKQQLKAASVIISPKGKKLKVPVNAVMAMEENPPKGETPITWILITSLSIGTFDEAFRVIKYYLCRWEIELFFKVLKSGCKYRRTAIASYRQDEKLNFRIHDS